MIICAPYAPLFAKPDLKSEQIDEVIYGMECEIIESVAGFHKIRMFYNYEGWIEKPYIIRELHKPNMIVDAPFADLLPEAKNYYKPIVSLPRGARLDVGFSKQYERYGFAVLPNKKVFYIHKRLIKDIEVKHLSERSFREGIANAALSYLGTQYRWGGKTPAGIDCSGLAFMAYYLNGVTIYRDADITRSPNVKEINIEQAKKGDLLYFSKHMAVYLGNGDYVHASAKEGKVVYGSFNNYSAFFNKDLSDKLIHTGTIF